MLKILLRLFGHTRGLGERVSDLERGHRDHDRRMTALEIQSHEDRQKLGGSLLSLAASVDQVRAELRQQHGAIQHVYSEVIKHLAAQGEEARKERASHARLTRIWRAEVLDLRRLIVGDAGPAMNPDMGGRVDPEVGSEDVD
jgi:hypothetical protein